MRGEREEGRRKNEELRMKTGWSSCILPIASLQVAWRRTDTRWNCVPGGPKLHISNLFFSVNPHTPTDLPPNPLPVRKGERRWVDGPGMQMCRAGDFLSISVSIDDRHAMPAFPPLSSQERVPAWRWFFGRQGGEVCGAGGGSLSADCCLFSLRLRVFV